MDQNESQNMLNCTKMKNSDGSETIHYPAFYKGVPKEFKNFAEKELGETPEKLSRGFKYLKKFLEDKGLPQTDEIYMLAVLRNCKYDLKKSKVKLEKFLKARELIAENVAAMDQEKIDFIVRDGSFTVLPYRDKHGRMIVVTRPRNFSEVYSVNDGFICYMAMMLFIVEFPMTSLFGVTYIAEAKTPSLPLLFQILKAYKSWLKTYFDLPIGLRKIDVTNESIVVRWFMNFARPVTPTKIYKRITMHGDNFEILKEMFHPDLLPEDFDGNMGPINSKHYHEEFLDFLMKLKDEHLKKMAAQS